MLYAKDFRMQAYDALTGRWGLAIGTAFVAGLLGSTVGVSRLSNSILRRSDDMYFNNIMLLIYLAILGALVLYSLVLFFISGAITLGYCQFNLNLVERRNVRFSDLFSKFGMFWKAFLMQLLMGLFIFLWSLLLIIPGIVAAYSYAMTPYILLENPDLPVLEAISRSKQMMQGNKGRLFCLHISFIGWFLLSILTCGIGFLWLRPYVEAANAVFYNEISGKNMRFNQEFHNYGSNNNGYADNGYSGYNNQGNSSQGFNNQSYNNQGNSSQGNNNQGYNNQGDNSQGNNNQVNNNNGYNNNGYNNNGYNNNGPNSNK